MAGLVVGGLAVLAQALLDFPSTRTELALFRGAAMLPGVLAALGGWQRLRWPQGMGVALMAVMGLAYLLRFSGNLLHLSHALEAPRALGPVIPGVLLPLGAWLLRPPRTDAAP